MRRTGRLPVVREGDVDRLLDQHPGVPLGDERGLPGGDRGVDPAPGLADSPPGGGLVGLGQVGDRPVGQGERAAVAGVGESGRLELVEIAGGGDRGQRVGRRRLDPGDVGRARVIAGRNRGGHTNLPGGGGQGQQAV